MQTDQKMLWRKPTLKDARTGVGKSKGREVVICCMDFAFIGGSMGAVVVKNLKRDQSLYQQNSLYNDFKIRGARWKRLIL
jgi:acetyl-CoA carboxylase carboxyl transferase subunit beta